MTQHRTMKELCKDFLSTVLLNLIFCLFMHLPDNPLTSALVQNWTVAPLKRYCTYETALNWTMILSKMSIKTVFKCLFVFSTDTISSSVFQVKFQSCGVNPSGQLFSLPLIRRPRLQQQKLAFKSTVENKKTTDKFSGVSISRLQSV